MFVYRLISSAMLVAFCTAGIAATSPAPKKSAVKASAGPQRLKGKQETLACRLGTEDRHARIAVVLIGGKTDSFAYYSKWKPRTCSIYLQRWRDSYSKWDDNGALTTVSLERGAFLIEHKKNEYHFIFRDIDRERYCGMDGVINGSLTIKKGNDQCQLDGEIMVEGTPLGQAFVNRKEDKPPPGLMPVDVPASAAAQAGPDAPERSATAVVSPAPTSSSPSAPASAAQSAPAAKPEAAKAETATEQPKAETAKVDAPKVDAASAAVPKAEAPKAEAPKAPAQKAAESSGNPLRSFFRSMSPGTPPTAPETR
jgi:pyruvate/2-oxoglutarate dehydrogenase complex dihydrolipoamide acyltransferase (E2) component